MTSDPAAAFRAAAEAAQAGAGIIAARHRGDLASADALLEGLPDAQKAAGFLLLAEVAVMLLSRYEDRPAAEVAAELSLQLAAHAPGTPDGLP